MAIKNLDGISNQQLATELQRGAKFVVFYYTISIVLMTFRRGSDIYLLRPGESAVKHGWPFLLLSLVLGWWGFPWGPIYTIQSIFTAFTGKDVTAEVVSQVNRGRDTSQVTYDQKF
jgi:hypothetical protein